MTPYHRRYVTGAILVEATIVITFGIFALGALLSLTLFLHKRNLLEHEVSTKAREVAVRETSVASTVTDLQMELQETINSGALSQFITNGEGQIAIVGTPRVFSFCQNATPIFQVLSFEAQSSQACFFCDWFSSSGMQVHVDVVLNRTLSDAEPCA